MWPFTEITMQNMKKTMIVAAVIAAAWAGWWLAERRAAIQGDTIVRVDTITRTDTIIARAPVARDCTLVRYITARVPVTRSDTAAGGQAAVREDTAEAALPITQRRYTDDSTYTAWVSGYQPRLDSICTYRRTATITREIVRPAPRGRWSAGVQAGYGMTPRGPQPYIGLGVGFRLTR